MADDIVLTSEERDCLQELINISYGSATAAISKIIDRFATLSIPSIKIISSDGLKEHLSSKLKDGNTFFISNQLINGSLAGQNLFLIDNKSAINLAIEFGLEDDELIQEEIEDIILEITNILSSTASSKLGELLDTNVGFSSPSIKYVKSKLDFQNDFDSNYDSIIIISTNLEFESQNIKAELVFMKNKQSFVYLKEKLIEFINEY
jgi:chemotaxis protein CheC